MKIAGIGFRETADISSLRSALMSAGGTDGVMALATATEKAEAMVLVALAAEFHLPIRAIAPDALAAVETLTKSERVAARFGTGSLAEAAALAAAGPAARLLGPRAVSADGMATAAIAEGDGP
ncbi:MAG: cobalamin biosynthesis protein [Xanthobacteraceae bacterium]|nr:cobalamin biosynthesis protein [Xanthobacteraceae bacterium]